MTEKEIQLLGFEKELLEPIQCTDVDTEETWEEDGGHYYIYRVASGLEFISNVSDETEDGDWYVEFFDTDPAVRFYKFAEVQALLNTLNKHIVK